MFLAKKLNNGAGTPPPSVDDKFNYVTMLLHGDGTNGAQNNTFIDSSSNALSITRNGNTTQGSFSPYGSNWSNAFDGTGDRLFISNVTNLGFGTGDFTVELWANFNGSAVEYGFVGSVNSGGMDFVYHSTGSLRIGQLGISWDSIFTPFTPVIGTWYHIAFTRSGSTARAFVDGVQVGSDSTNTVSYDPSA